MTAASDDLGWVSFLIRVLALWYGTQKHASTPIFDKVLNREDILSWNEKIHSERRSRDSQRHASSIGCHASASNNSLRHD